MKSPYRINEGNISHKFSLTLIFTYIIALIFIGQPALASPCWRILKTGSNSGNIKTLTRAIEDSFNKRFKTFLGLPNVISKKDFNNLIRTFYLEKGVSLEAAEDALKVKVLETFGWSLETAQRLLVYQPQIVDEMIFVKGVNDYDLYYRGLHLTNKTLYRKRPKSFEKKVFISPGLSTPIEFARRGMPEQTPIILELKIPRFLINRISITFFVGDKINPLEFDPSFLFLSRVGLLQSNNSIKWYSFEEATQGFIVIK